MRVRELLIVCELTTNSHSGGVSTQHTAEHTHTHKDTERVVSILMVCKKRVCCR